MYYIFYFYFILLSSFHLDYNANSFLVVRRDPGDRETFVDIENFVNSVGEDNVLVGLPRRRGDESESYKIPQPQTSSSGAVTRTMVSLLLIVLTSVINNKSCCT